MTTRCNVRHVLWICSDFQPDLAWLPGLANEAAGTVPVMNPYVSVNPDPVLFLGAAVDIHVWLAKLVQSIQVKRIGVFRADTTNLAHNVDKSSVRKYQLVKKAFRRFLAKPGTRLVNGGTTLARKVLKVRIPLQCVRYGHSQLKAM